MVDDAEKEKTMVKLVLTGTPPDYRSAAAARQFTEQRQLPVFEAFGRSRGDLRIGRRC